MDQSVDDRRGGGRRRASRLVGPGPRDGHGSCNSNCKVLAPAGAAAVHCAPVQRLSQGSPSQRSEAAQRLVQIDTPEAHAIVTRGLSGNDDKEAQLACARAIADGDVTDPQWLTPLTALLGRGQALTEAASRALASFDHEPRAYQPLIQFARTRQQPYRATVVRALGAVVERPVAEALVSLVGDTTEDPAVRIAAADALEQLSGQTDNGQDAHRWAVWWDARKLADPADWRAQVLAEQHSVLEREADRTREQLRQFKGSVHEVLLNQYNRQSAAEKPRMLLGFLNDSNPDVREIGASIVPDAVASGQPMTDEIHTRLIELVHDASADVRRQATRALSELSDANALGAVLVQLQIEKKLEVKIALLQAIARIGTADERAVPILQQLLQDPSTQVAAAAADAIRALGPAIQNTPRARDVLQELDRTLQQRTGPPGQPNNEPGSDDLRAALVAAMGAMVGNNPPASLEDLFSSLLSQNETPRTRRAALQGLANIGQQTGSGDVIANQLKPEVEPDPAVRQAAAQALGEVGSFNYAKALDYSTLSQNEPDKQVREAAWKAFENLLTSASATPPQLAQWADVFHRRADRFDRRIELEREVAVRTELAHKLEAAVQTEQAQKLDPANDLQNLAVEQQLIGEVYLQLGQPADAVPFLRHALTYWEATNAQPQTIVNLVRELMLALLQSGQYQDAVKFGEQEIRRDPANQQEVGPAIRNAADQLIQKGDKGDPASYRDAAALIHDAMTMNPPLDETYRDLLLHTLAQRIPTPATNPSR